MILQRFHVQIAAAGRLARVGLDAARAVRIHAAFGTSRSRRRPAGPALRSLTARTLAEPLSEMASLAARLRKALPVLPRARMGGITEPGSSCKVPMAPACGAAKSADPGSFAHDGRNSGVRLGRRQLTSKPCTNLRNASCADRKPKSGKARQTPRLRQLSCSGGKSQVQNIKSQFGVQSPSIPQ